jgi:hypothetical protein
MLCSIGHCGPEFFDDLVPDLDVLVLDVLFHLQLRVGVAE